MEDWRAAGFGVYVHWPFCLHKCPYCDFNSHVSSRIDQAEWRSALTGEIARTAALVPGRRVDTVFFGGGTPSLMPAESVAVVVEAIDRHWGIGAGAEISLEANPTSVEAERFGGYALAGVNRISLGVQALNDRDLRVLGRMHSAAEAIQAFDIARKLFSRVSFDLIYARQHQSLAEWRDELGLALDLAVDHLSLYQLTIEGGTRFGDMKDRGSLRGLPDDGLAADLYQLTQELAAAGGIPAYEISNHARPGAEARHNLIYWRGGDFAGIGPGAHGRLTVGGRRLATSAVRDPAAWLAAARRGCGELPVERLSGQEHAAEYLMMALRLAEGCDLARFRDLGGEINERVLDDLQQEGFLVRLDDRLRGTASGQLVLDAILARLVN